MTLKQIYNLFIEMGIKNDLRGAARVKSNLAKAKKSITSLMTSRKKNLT